MKVTKILGSLVAVGIAFVGLTATTESRAGGDEELVNIKCSGGQLEAKASKPWHTNKAAPWKWDKGEKVEASEEHVTFKGAKCEGTVKAFVCNGDQCKGPIAVPVH